jgi:hypothetical protein
MTQRAMKIKVDVQTLISRIEKAKDGAVRQYEKDLVKYETQRATWMKRSAEALTTALAALNKGDDSGVISDNKYLDGRCRPVVSVPVARGEGPIKPRKPDTGKHDRDLALLRMTSDETILISTDDAFASYL